MQNQKSVRRAPLTSLGFPSPHALLETADHYSIVMNLLDTPSRRIGIRVDRQRREVAVFVRKDSALRKRALYWIFGIPADGAVDAATFRKRAGVIEIQIPRVDRWLAAA
jgi:hypothetical protein